MIDPALNSKYSQDEIDRAIEVLSYKEVTEMPKQEDSKFPILYIFRHGQSEDNKDYIFSGWRDSDLTEKGIEQAKVLAEKMKDKKIGILFSSPQQRALKTMQIAMSLNENSTGELEIIQDPRLRERSYGDLQGKSKLELMLEDEKLLNEYRRSYTKKAENGESLEEVVARVKEFCDELVPLMLENKINVAVSCHGNTIRGFRKYFENLTEEEVCKFETPLAQDYISYNIKSL